jgi:hypothetical protein
MREGLWYSGFGAGASNFTKPDRMSDVTMVDLLPEKNAMRYDSKALFVAHSGGIS